jgi:hypothetical protein
MYLIDRNTNRTGDTMNYQEPASTWSHDEVLDVIDEIKNLGYVLAEPYYDTDAAIRCPQPDTSDDTYAVTHNVDNHIKGGGEQKNWSDLIHYIKTYGLCECLEHPVPTITVITDSDGRGDREKQYRWTIKVPIEWETN